RSPAVRIRPLGRQRRVHLGLLSRRHEPAIVLKLIEVTHGLLGGFFVAHTRPHWIEPRERPYRTALAGHEVVVEVELALLVPHVLFHCCLTRQGPLGPLTRLLRLAQYLGRFLKVTF